MFEPAVIDLAKAGGPVFGSIIAILVFVILGMTVYIKSLVSQTAISEQQAIQRREETQEKLNKVFEARVQESRLAVTAIEQNTSKIVEFGQLSGMRGQTIERIVLILEKLVNDFGSMSVSRREYVIKIENMILENREAVKRAENRIDEKIERLNKCCKALGVRLEEVIHQNVNES